MKKVLAHEIWEDIFVPALHKKFCDEIQTTTKFEGMVFQEGGKIKLDHGATRTVEVRIHEFITRLAKAFTLEPCGHYEFPDKHLTAVDLQFKDRDGFKWFSTLIKYDEFSKEAKEAIDEDITRSHNVMSDEGLDYLARLEYYGKLDLEDAERFVHEIVYGFLSRQGSELKKSTYELVKKESSEAVNALLLGPDFNHIAYVLNELSIQDWYGQEVIEVLNARMLKDGFEMLPEIQGSQGGILRQTSTKADLMEFEVLKDNGDLETIKSPAKFIELIQRGVMRDEDGKLVFGEDKKVKLYRGFIASNTVKLYESTKID